MNRTFETMQACLLCDFGEILCRAQIGEGRPEQRGAWYFRERLPHSIAEAIRYCREVEPPSIPLADDAIACVVHVARRIALGNEESSGTVSDRPSQSHKALESIFNHLNHSKGQAYFAAEWTGGGIQYPSRAAQNSEDAYKLILERWEETLDGQAFEPSHSNTLLESLERCFSYVPAPGYDRGRCDVSFFHHSKAVAAIGCCLERWLTGRGIVNCREALFSSNTSLMEAEPFVLFSLDLSGIQSFIYTISNKGALKGLRVRSFYLSMLMEHIADMILEACQLCRVNLIYSGGGRAHLLLPNDGLCVERAEEVVRLTNDFLREHYDAALFLACGCAKATVKQLSSADGSAQGFSELFRAASRGISQQKLQRYGADELLELNRKDKQRASDRECAICGRSGLLQPHGENEMVCETCGRLERFSNTLTEDNLLLAVKRTGSDTAIPLPGGLWLTPTDAMSQSDDSVRMYCINGDHAFVPDCVWLHMGNYRAANSDGSAMTFEQLAEASSGVKRLGVLRADVDNLGMLFASGLAVAEDANPHRFETLPRYMALSSAMTAFFQREINRIIGQIKTTWIPDGKPSDPRRVSIVYSGGDDVFLVGAWNEVLDAGLALQEAFTRYTGGGVTLSAGLGLFTPHEPVGAMADITAELEESAKLIKDGQKNAVALFAPVAPGQNDVSCDFHWDELRGNIIGEKVQLLCRIFEDTFSKEQEAGNAFLYQVLIHLRDVDSNSIAIARLAYLLARHAPEVKRNADEREKERVKRYVAFSKSVYQWALDREENRALQAAILLHVYSHRGERDSDV